jgi:predicted esterase
VAPTPEAPSGPFPHDVLEIAVPRTARCVVVGAPSDAAAVWYALHGYGQLAEPFARNCLPLAGEGRALVVPEGLSRFYLRGGGGAVGASWMTREARESDIRDYVGYLDAVHAHLTGTARPAHVLGFSQGAATAYRWAVRGAVRPGRLVLWGGGVPPDLNGDRARERLAGVDVVLVNGRSDPHISGGAVERDIDRLLGLGLTARAVWFDGGHHLDAAALRSLAV